jgi:hypothetical protein
MQPVKHFLLPIRSRHNRFDNSKPTKYFLNQSQTKQTITDLSYSYKRNILCRLRTLTKLLLTQKKTNRIVL